MLTSISADIMEKLKILSDAAKFDVACTSSGASRSVMEMIWGVHLPVEYVIRLQLMAGVYRFSRYFLQMNVFMIANTVSTDALMMLKE